MSHCMYAGAAGAFRMKRQPCDPRAVADRSHRRGTASLSAGIGGLVQGVMAFRIRDDLAWQSDEDAKNFEISGSAERTPETLSPENKNHPASSRLFVQLCSAFTAHREVAGS